LPETCFGTQKYIIRNEGDGELNIISSDSVYTDATSTLNSVLKSVTLPVENCVGSIMGNETSCKFLRLSLQPGSDVSS